MHHFYDIRLLLVWLLCVGSAVPLSSQQERFVKIYTDSVSLTGVGITETATGFELEQEPVFYQAPYHFQNMLVGPQGDRIAAQVTTIPGDPEFDPVFELADGTYARSAHNSHRLQRFAADGTLIWDTTYVVPDYPIIANSVWNPTKMISMASNGDLLVGFRASAVGDYCVARINANKEIVWVNKFWNYGPFTGNISASNRYFHFLPLSDGSFLLTLNTSSGSIFSVFKISAAGETLWQKAFQMPPLLVKATSDGGVWVSTREVGEGRLVRYGPDGTILFSQTINQMVILPPPYFGAATAMIEMPDSTVVMAGHYSDFHDVFFMRMDLQGNLLWFWKGVLFANATLRIRAGVATADGGFAWTGDYNGNETILIKTDSIGRVTTNYVAGHVRWDQNVDCLPDSAENPIANWIIQLKKQSNIVTYAITNADGYYEMPITDIGNYSVTALPPSFIWDACTDVLPFSVPQDTGNLTVVKDFAAQNGFDCPIMSVNLGIPFLRRCFNSYVTLRCCNDGVMDAQNALLEVLLPPYLALQSASYPYTLSGDTLRIQFDTFEALTCKQVSLVVIPDCDSTEIGEAMCITARMFPDSICAPIPGWSGALIEVSAACEQDSVHFQIQNVGDTQSQLLDYIVIDDHVMSLMGTFTLPPDGVKNVVLPATGGTMRIQAEQEPNAPGTAMPSVAIEGCGVDSSGNSSLGFVIQWPNENGAPFSDTKCAEVRSSFDPNDKSAVPKGVTDQHFIQPNTPIDYMIRFQNTGNDTAFTVVIKDVIIPWLNILSIRPGASSHPYTMSFEGLYTVVFTFSNILLPDSTTNFDASMGFVQFQIQQKENIENFTIPNEASIFFDYNLPVLTNSTFHTVRTQIIAPLVVPVKTVVRSTIPDLELWPNPAQSSIWVKSPYPNGFVVVTDVLGREVRRQQAETTLTTIARNQLPAGVYWVQWTGDQGMSQMEKVVWK